MMFIVEHPAAEVELKVVRPSLSHDLDSDRGIWYHVNGSSQKRSVLTLPLLIF